VENELESRRARISELANKMARLYVLGHTAVQSAEYEATAQEYLQANVDAMFPDELPGTHSHYTTG